MDLKLRPGTLEDAEACGRICYEAFAVIAKKHNFPPDVPADAAVGLMSMLLSHQGFYSVVAEANGQVVGSNFLDERSTIAGVGPITVDPAVQDGGVGRALMQDVMRRAAERTALGIRLVQSAYHNRSLSLYAMLGFQVREQLACMQGAPPQGEIPGHPRLLSRAQGIGQRAGLGVKLGVQVAQQIGSAGTQHARGGKRAHLPGW